MNDELFLPLPAFPLVIPLQVQIAFRQKVLYWVYVTCESLGRACGSGAGFGNESAFFLD